MKTFHIILAIKPFKGNFASNALKSLPCALGIDVSRVNIVENKNQQHGRWPTNVILEENNEISKFFPYTKSGKPCGIQNVSSRVYGQSKKGRPLTGIGDEGSASRFFKQIKSKE